ncbi:hypothetical protein, partial [Synechococcus sp. W55.1]|uniref:hypothetical protein n=1 Tax=Synechococcus sp. W55.1 TaxID=2964512 RepID=UPI0039C4669D
MAKLFGASIPAYRGSLPVAQLHCNLAFLFLSVMSEALHQALANRDLGCVDLSFEPKESTDEIEKTQEVPG